MLKSVFGLFTRNTGGNFLRISRNLSGTYNHSIKKQSSLPQYMVSSQLPLDLPKTWIRSGILPKPDIINPCIINPHQDPLNTNVKEWILPTLQKESMDETDLGVVIEKHAVRMIVIRRKKMKKHKLRKLRKRMRFLWRKVRINRRIKKEKWFQAEMVALVKKAEAFKARDFVAEKLKLAHEIPKITRIRGFVPPDDVLKEYLRDKEESERIKQRVEECIRRLDKRQQRS